MVGGVTCVQTDDHNFRKTASPGWVGQQTHWQKQVRRQPPPRCHVFLVLLEGVRWPDDASFGKKVSVGPWL